MNRENLQKAHYHEMMRRQSIETEEAKKEDISEGAKEKMGSKVDVLLICPKCGEPLVNAPHNCGEFAELLSSAKLLAAEHGGWFRDDYDRLAKIYNDAKKQCSWLEQRKEKESSSVDKKITDDNLEIKTEENKNIYEKAFMNLKYASEHPHEYGDKDTFHPEILEPFMRKKADKE